MMKRSLVIFLSLAIVLSVFPMTVFTTEYSDMPNNWSRVALENAIANDLLKGDNGKIRGDDSFTRAEMATIVNRSFQSEKTYSLKNFKDVSPGDWYYKEMEKAVGMGIFKGDSGKLNPNENITREEAFLVLARAFKISEIKKGILDNFYDKNQISTWAKDEVAALVSAGYIAGSKGMINPKANITRAEFAQIMDNLINTYITKAGKYIEDYKGNVMINKSGVILKGITVEGDLIIGDGVGDGEITLDGVTVNDRILVRGGGENSISIIGNSNVKDIIVARIDGKVRVYSEKGAEIGEVTLDGNDDVILEGRFETINIITEDIKVIVEKANIELVRSQGANITIDVDESSTIENLVANGKATIIKGEGNVKKVMANGDNIIVNTKGTEVKVGKDTKGVTVRGKKLDPGKTERIKSVVTPRPVESGEESRPSSTDTNSPVVQYQLILRGEGLTSNPGFGLIDYKQLVIVTLKILEDKEIKQFLVDGEDKKEHLVGSSNEYTYTFKMEKDTKIEVSYEDKKIPDDDQLETPIVDGVISATEVKAGQNLEESHLSGTFKNTCGKKVEGELKWSEDNKAIVETSSFSWEFNPLDIYNYRSTKGTVEVIYKDFVGGDGTSDNPYQVSNAEQLNNVRKHLGVNKYFKQIDNINLSVYLAENGDGYNKGEGWLPIGGNDKEFNGGYDGGNFEVSNLRIDREEVDYQGLFGAIGNTANLSNIGLRDVDIKAGNKVGGLVGTNKNGAINNNYATGNIMGKSNVGGLVGANLIGTINNCYSTCSVMGISNDVGGLVGRNYKNGNISNSYATGIVDGKSNVGGLLGINDGGKIESSYAKGEVTGEFTGNSSIGGLVGENQQGGTINNCYATGFTEGIDKIISSGTLNIGGLVGYNNTGNIDSCYATGEITVTSTNLPLIGGLVGKIQGGTITRSYYDTQTTKQSDSDKGVGKTTEEMMTRSTFSSTTNPVSAGWDFNTIWKMNDPPSYPKLQWQKD